MQKSRGLISDLSTKISFACLSKDVMIAKLYVSKLIIYLRAVPFICKHNKNNLMEMLQPQQFGCTDGYVIN